MYLTVTFVHRDITLQHLLITTQYNETIQLVFIYLHLYIYLYLSSRLLKVNKLTWQRTFTNLNCHNFYYYF